jgi:hypothetical protein
VIPVAERRVLDVPRISFKVGESAFSPIVSLHSVLRAAGEKITYRYLMGVSGAAFRLYWMDGFDPSSASVSSESPALLAARSLGYAYHEQAGLTLADTWNRITASIDAGMAVPACGVVPPPEWQVICGYDPARPRKLLVESYFDPEPTAPSEVPFQKWVGWGSYDMAMPFAIVRKAGPTPPHHLAAVEALARALQLALEHEHWSGRGGRKGGRLWHSGLAAYDAWAADLRAPADAKAAARHLFVNDLTAYTLEDARLCAATFMDSLAGEFPSARHYFDVAKAAYHQEAEAIAAARKILPYPWDQHPRVKPAAVAGFADPEVRGPWAEALRRAKEFEARAVEQLMTAVNALR